jgi:hypothetical protein
MTKLYFGQSVLWYKIELDVIIESNGPTIHLSLIKVYSLSCFNIYCITPQIVAYM